MGINLEEDSSIKLIGMKDHNYEFWEGMIKESFVIYFKISFYGNKYFWFFRFSDFTFIIKYQKLQLSINLQIILDNPFQRLIIISHKKTILPMALFLLLNHFMVQ